RAVMIYQQRDRELDLPITRVELLSPANKPPDGSYHRTYEDKRKETLAAGLNLVEIDYLHQTPPLRPLQELVRTYSPKGVQSRETDAVAYYVAVTRPHPLESHPSRQGLQLTTDVDIYRFGVDQPIPTIALPLSKADPAIAVDL